jgi:hypothetical protein
MINRELGNHVLGDYARIIEPIGKGFTLFELVKLSGIHYENEEEILYRFTNKSGTEHKLKRSNFQWIKDI